MPSSPSISSALSSLASTPAGATASGTTDRFSQLQTSDFVKIMMSELTNQDPLKPNDSNTLMQQFASLQNIEANLTLQQKLGDVLSQGQLSTAGALLGKYITGYTENFDPVEGIVRSVSNTADGPVLKLDNGASVPFKNINEILDTTGSPPTPDPTPTPN